MIFFDELENLPFRSADFVRDVCSWQNHVEGCPVLFCFLFARFLCGLRGLGGVQGFPLRWLGFRQSSRSFLWKGTGEKIKVIAGIYYVNGRHSCYRRYHWINLIFTFVDLVAFLGGGAAGADEDCWVLVGVDEGGASAFANAGEEISAPPDCVPSSLWGGMINPEGIMVGSSVWAASFSIMVWMSSGLSSSYWLKTGNGK